MSRVFISFETIPDQQNPIPSQYFVIPLNFGDKITDNQAHKIANVFSSDIEDMFKRINHETISVIHEDSINHIFIDDNDNK